jgi:hypothetical protein
MLATIIDTDAFWHVAPYGVLGAVGLVVAFGVALLGLDRAEDRTRAAPSPDPPASAGRR